MTSENGHDVQHSQLCHRWQICLHDFLCDGKCNVCTISHHLLDIRKNNKIQKFDIENEGQGQGGQKLELRHSTGNVIPYR